MLNAYNRSRRVVLAAGVFDLFHHGHLEFLQKCRHIAGTESWLVVLVNSDAFTESYKGRAPVIPELDRVKQVRDTGLADTAFILPAHNDQKRILDEWNPALVVHGTDWTGEELYRQFGVDKAWLDERGILFVYVDPTPGISTTQLRAEMEQK